jgi:hypothetical protein
MRSMRQQRYAMDLSEHSLTIVHRAGPNMHLADALSRCGYSRDMADTTVERIQKHPQELCSVEEMRKYFKPEVQYEYLRARLRAAEGAQVSSIAEEYERLSTEAVVTKLVPESEEEESRTVQFYDMVMAMPRRSPRVRAKSEAAQTPGV